MRSLAAVSIVMIAGTASAHRAHASPNARPFTVDWAPALLTAEPTFGIPGTEVRITGVTFPRGVQCFFGEHPMAVIAANRREVIAMVPLGVHGQDYIFITDGASQRARTDDMFVIERQHGSHFHRW